MLIDYSREDRMVLINALELFIKSTSETRSDHLAAKILLNTLKNLCTYTGPVVDSTTVYTSPTSQDDLKPWLNYGDCL